jgi:hypothetical protein
MGGAFSKKGSKKEKEQRSSDKLNRRLSVSGLQAPQADSNTVPVIVEGLFQLGLYFSV